MADLTKQEGRFRSGETLVPGAGISATGGMVGSFGDAMTPTEFVKTHGAEAAREMVAMNNVLREELQRAAEERAEIARQVFEQAREEFELQGEILAQMEGEAAGAGSGYAAAEMAESLSEQRALVDGLGDSVAGNLAAYEEATRAAEEYGRGVERAAANVKKAIEDLDNAASGGKTPPIPKINIGRKKKKGKPISEAEYILAQMGGTDRELMPDTIERSIHSRQMHSGRIGRTTDNAISQRDQRLKRQADQTAETQHALNLRLAAIRGDSFEVERLEEERRFADESERFKGFAESREELERAHQDKLNRIREDAAMAEAARSAETVAQYADAGAAVTRSVSTMMSSFGNLANARMRSAQVQLKAGKITQAQYEKEVKSANKFEEQLIIAQGVLHAFLGGSSAAKAFSAFADKDYPGAIAHTAASVAHFAQAAIAPQMARYARDANAAGLAAAGVSGGGGGGGGGMGYSGANTGAPTTEGLTERGENRPTVQFGDIVLSDVPLLFGDDGLEVLGTRIAGHVAREMNNNGIPGTPRFRRQS
jgi:hypothetical protein